MTSRVSKLKANLANSMTICLFESVVLLRVRLELKLCIKFRNLSNLSIRNLSKQRRRSPDFRHFDDSRSAMSATTQMAQFVPRIRPDLITRQGPAWRAPVCIHEARRTFAVHQRNQASKAAGQKMGIQLPKGHDSLQSVKLQMKKGMKGLKNASKIPDDMGLLPGATQMQDIEC